MPFPELIENKIIVRKGEKITKIDFKQENFNKKDFGSKIKFCYFLLPELKLKEEVLLTNEIKQEVILKRIKRFLNKNEKLILN